MTTLKNWIARLKLSFKTMLDLGEGPAWFDESQ
jgi:hypothetical protein